MADLWSEKKQKQEPLEMFSCSPFQAQHEAILMTYGPGFRNRSFQGCAEKMSTSPWMGFFHIPVVSRSTGDDFRKTKMWSVFIGCKLLLSGFIFFKLSGVEKNLIESWCWEILFIWNKPFFSRPHQSGLSLLDDAHFHQELSHHACHDRLASAWRELGMGQNPGT